MANERPPEVVRSTEYPELGQTERPRIPGRKLNTDYPLIDSDPHFWRVLSYARTSDYVAGGAMTAALPSLFWWMDRVSPADVGVRAHRQFLRLSGIVGLAAGFALFYSRSIHRFYGFSENRREIEMDMREMTDRVKKGEPLYGVSKMTDYMQGAASRQSRYSGVFFAVMPWFNFVNHNHHGVDTAKYYQQAERELEAERTGNASS